MADNNIEVQYACSDDSLSNPSLMPQAAMFRQWTEQTLKHTASTGSVCLRLVEGDEMRALNDRYRGKDKLTNVLSFPADIAPLPGTPSLLGDIAICAQVVEFEASQQNKPGLNHWAHITVHGVLHLLGYDHQSEDEANIMENLEVEILSQLNIPNPYLEQDGVDE